MTSARPYISTESQFNYLKGTYENYQSLYERYAKPEYLKVRDLHLKNLQEFVKEHPEFADKLKQPEKVKVSKEPIKPEKRGCLTNLFTLCTGSAR